jgi:recombinational DNA repair ATPase RecF|tara:strand:- start:350 stop:577 length:228 start_codon:yes stop_codon:yes gene_type:complete
MQNGNGKSNIIELSDILEQKLRKERELIFYEAQLAHLVVKMQLVKKEIEITNIIIDLVNKEKIIDIQEYVDKKEH